MEASLPAVLSVNLKVPGLGSIRQIAVGKQRVICTAVAYTRERDIGHLLTGPGGERLLYLFPTKPKTALPADANVLVASYGSTTEDTLELSHGEWSQHSLAPAGRPAHECSAEALASWKGTFSFREEVPQAGVLGLRRPQIGALHAIHAHWSVSSETATIVMPTGTGKTETMLSVLTSAQCTRVLVVVPTDALRTQIAEKFATLGVLKAVGSVLLGPEAKRPVVGTLTSRPKTREAVEDFFAKCNVIVTTSQLAGGCRPDVRARMAELCTHLFIDEAHHAEAPTWKKFRQDFEARRILQFTATPFREDGQRVDGKLAYVYPLRKAQEEGYFRPIRFHAVHEFNAERGDRSIAEAALDELDRDATGLHVVMARVASVARAEEILGVYQRLGRYEAVAIHSDMSLQDRGAAKARLFAGQARVVVCVDMLGEGFDMPELKIAAFHDIRKSLAVTLQLAGRFTRSREDLGDPVFIANTALIDVADELRTLYAQDPDWNVLLPALNAAAIEEEVASQEFFRGFTSFLDEVPLKDLRPAASMVVYRTQCVNWAPKRFRNGFSGLSSRDQLYHCLNEVENTLVVLAATEGPVRWSDVESIRETNWELFIAVWDRDNALLYLHGSGISGEYKDLAKAICGTDAQLLVAPQLYRCFHDVKRLVLNNVGLQEHLGRQVSFTSRMGSDVESRIGQAARRGAKKAVLAGKGYEHGERTSVGAAKRGRVWSSQRFGVDSFVSWARGIGAKLVDEEIDPDVVLAGTLKPIAVGAVPHGVVIAAEWPLEIIRDTERSTTFSGPGIPEKSSTDVDIEVVERGEGEPVVVRVFCEAWDCLLRLNIFAVDESFDFEFERIGGRQVDIRRGRASQALAEYFTNNPPVLWFADGSSLEGCEYTQLPNADLLPFPRERLRAFDWTGVDIRAESQGEARLAGTIQHYVISQLQLDASYAVIFDDDGPNEAADVVAIREPQADVGSAIEVDLFHLKYAGGAPGARIDDLYVVCGQAQRSTCWLDSTDRKTELFIHLLKRNAARTDAGRSTRFERGNVEVLMRIRDMSRRLDVKLRVFIVQPGLSRAAATHNQMTLLAVTERFLTDTYEVPLEIWCSE